MPMFASTLVFVLSTAGAALGLAEPTPAEAAVAQCVAEGGDPTACAEEVAAAIAAADADAPGEAPAPGEAAPGEPVPRDALPSEPAQAEPAQADAVPTEAAQAEPAQAEPAQAEPAQAEPAPEAAAPPNDADTPTEMAAQIAEGEVPEGETMEEAHPGMEPAEYLALLRDVLRTQKEQVGIRLEEKIAQKQDEKMATMSSVLGWLSLAGLGLLFLPIFLRKKYPGQDALLMKYSALAAGVCVIAMFLFSQVLLLLRGIQGALSSVTNPQVAVIDATFQVLDDNVEDLVDVGPVLIEAPLAQVASGEQDSLPMAILDNVSRINDDVAIFKNIARQFEGVFALFGYLPIVLTVVAVVLFILSIKPVILEIARMPGRVAAGEVAGGDVVKQVFRTIGRELLATLCLIGALVVVTIFSGLMLTLAVEPAIEAFLAYVFTSLMYTIASPDFSKFAVYASVMGALMFLVLNVAAVLVTNVLFLGKAQKIFKRRFHERVRLGEHKRFWLWGSLSLVWAQLLPILFVAAAQEGVGALIDALTKGDDIPWTAVLVSGPAILVFGFILVFWAARGIKAVTFIMKYRPQDAAGGSPNPGRGNTARYRAA